MKKNINTILLLLANILLIANLVISSNQPSIEQIEKKIQHWGLHYGSHFSARRKAFERRGASAINKPVERVENNQSK